jgi:hypothetical protein
MLIKRFDLTNSTLYFFNFQSKSTVSVLPPPVLPQLKMGNTIRPQNDPLTAEHGGGCYAPEGDPPHTPGDEFTILGKHNRRAWRPSFVVHGLDNCRRMLQKNLDASSSFEEARLRIMALHGRAGVGKRTLVHDICFNLTTTDWTIYEIETDRQLQHILRLAQEKPPPAMKHILLLVSAVLLQKHGYTHETDWLALNALAQRRPRTCLVYLLERPMPIEVLPPSVLEQVQQTAYARVPDKTARRAILIGLFDEHFKSSDALMPHMEQLVERTRWYTPTRLSLLVKQALQAYASARNEATTESVDMTSFLRAYFRVQLEHSDKFLTEQAQHEQKVQSLPYDHVHRVDTVDVDEVEGTKRGLMTDYERIVQLMPPPDESASAGMKRPRDETENPAPPSYTFPPPPLNTPLLTMGAAPTTVDKLK